MILVNKSASTSEGGVRHLGNVREQKDDFKAGAKIHKAAKQAQNEENN